LSKRYYSHTKHANQWLVASHLIFAVAIIIMALLSSCSFPGLASTSAQLPLVSEKATPQALPPIHFPQDEGAHNDLTEWWYYTGHLEGSDASGKTHQYGFELVVFQVQRSTLPAFYPAHFAISDITRAEFHYDQHRVSRVTSGTAGTNATAGIDLHVGDWSMRGVNGHDHLAAAMQDYTINLDLVGQKPAVLHNGNGVITIGLAGLSYYYSRTHMDVQGAIMDHNQPIQVTGLAWMDHQWGNFLTLGGSGWDWYSIQLNNNTEMMLCFIHDPDGKITSYIGYIDPSGQDIIIPPTSLRTRRDSGSPLSACPCPIPTDTWKSQATGITYPSGWQLDVDDPQLHVSLTLKPLLKNQELVVTESTGNIYWEGAIAIEGQSNGQPVNGQGYVELTSQFLAPSALVGLNCCVD
jgi:predicted secreted hydrolase